MNFKNMKIPVENNLNEIVGELERLGYVKPNEDGSTIYTIDIGNTFNSYRDLIDLRGVYKTTTLAELKEM